MLSYLLRRVLQMIPTLAGVILLVFFLFKFFGGDPAEILGGLQATAEQVESIRTQLGLNRPVWQQLWLFVAKVVTFDWGHSWATNESIADIFRTRLPATLMGDAPLPLVPVAEWGGTELVLPRGNVAQRWRDVLSGITHEGNEGADRLPLSDLLARLPVALLEVG